MQKSNLYAVKTDITDKHNIKYHTDLRMEN